MHVTDIDRRLVKDRFSSSHSSLRSIYLSAWQVMTCAEETSSSHLFTADHSSLFPRLLISSLSPISWKSNQCQHPQFHRISSHISLSLSKAKAPWRQHCLWFELWVIVTCLQRFAQSVNQANLPLPSGPRRRFWPPCLAVEQLHVMKEA